MESMLILLHYRKEIERNIQTERNTQMDDNNQPKKPIFLYVVIIVLVIALAGLGALSFFSL